MDDYKTTILTFYRTHQYNSITNVFITHITDILHVLTSNKFDRCKWIQAVADLITTDNINPALLKSTGYVLNVAAIIYFKNPTAAGAIQAQYFLTNHIKCELNKFKHHLRVRLMLAEFHMIELEYAKANAILYDIIEHAPPLTDVRGLAMLSQIRLISLYMSRFTDAAIMITHDYEAEIERIGRTIATDCIIISNAILGFIYRYTKNCYMKSHPPFGHLCAAVNHPMARPALLYLLGQTFEAQTQPNIIIYVMPFYITAANKEYIPAIVAVLQHFKSSHLNALCVFCECALHQNKVTSAIKYYTLKLMPTDPTLQTMFITLANRHISAFKYEYKCIVGLTTHSDTPKYRGTDKIAYNMDLLKKQQIYLNNYYNPEVTFCSVCFTDNVECYRYICCVHSFCKDCTKNISRRATLRKCPNCAIPEHSYFKDIWKIIELPAWKIAKRARLL